MIIRNLLYILQSENYNFKRFLKYAFSHGKWWALEKRQKLVWTPKIGLIYSGVWLLIIFILVVAVHFLGVVIFLLAILLEILLMPVLIVFVLGILKPLDVYLKYNLTKKAEVFLSKKEVLVVGITGSYGKTSTKEILSSILSEKFKVLKTPENINTDLGIANFILKNLTDEKIVIVEMGTHYPGDIAAICKMVKPNFSILTGINEAHLERFGKIDKIIKEKFYLPKIAKNFSVINLDDGNIKNNFEKFNLKNFVGVSKNGAKNITFKEDFGGISFEYQGENFSCGLLADHNVSLILTCIELAKKLGINLAEMKKGIEKIRPIEHRLSPIYNAASNIWVIDDSYNGNKDGFLSGIRVLARAKGRKVALIPGLVELGEKAEIIHNEIGEIYSRNVDLVLLIKNNVSDFIVAGMEKNNFKNYKVYNSTQEAHDDLKNVLKSGDTIIFQNDWTDNYF